MYRILCNVDGFFFYLIIFLLRKKTHKIYKIFSFSNVDGFLMCELNVERMSHQDYLCPYAPLGYKDVTVGRTGGQSKLCPLFEWLPCNTTFPGSCYRSL